MPLLGFGAASLAVLSGLPDTLALGFVIVGCAPGAMARNVIVDLGRLGRRRYYLLSGQDERGTPLRPLRPVCSGLGQ
jgi:hypothetical protein